MERLDTKALQRIASAIISYASVVLFFWAIYPYKWIRRLVWYARREQAKSEALYRAKNEGKAMYVIQNKMRFKVTSRAEARRSNTKIRKSLDDKHQGYVKWDYRNGLIFIAYPNGTQEEIDNTPIQRTTKKQEEDEE